MSHEDKQSILDSVENTEDDNNEQETILQKLADANSEIAELKMQIAWLERTYE